MYLKQDLSSWDSTPGPQMLTNGNECVIVSKGHKLLNTTNMQRIGDKLLLLLSVYYALDISFPAQYGDILICLF